MNINTPILWVLVPIFMALVTGTLFQRRTLSLILSISTALGLTLLAIFFPEDLTLSLGPFTITFVERLAFLGRQITIVSEMLPLVALVYLATTLWILSSWVTDTPEIFRPTSLVVSGLLTAALGVQPFLYAALLIQTAILATIPALSHTQKRPSPGILRYLGLQTIAMPFILIAGWLLTGIFTLPPDSPLVSQSMLVLGLGFALLLGVFPFHSWVPMISESSHPNVTSFLLFILPTTILTFGLNFFDRYAFLRTSQDVFQVLRMIGGLMVVLGGIWAAIQDDFKRAFGFAALMETGFSLIALGLAIQGGLNWLLMLFPARAMAYWLWGYTLSKFEVHLETLNLQTMQGFARRFPFLSLGLVTAQFSIAGLPLLASSPVKTALFTGILDVAPGLGIWVFVGNLGLFLFTFKAIASLVKPAEQPMPQSWSKDEKLSDYLPALIIIVVIILMGLFPQIFLDPIRTTLTAFTQLQ